MTRRRRDPRAETLALTTSTQPRRRIARGTPTTASTTTGRRRRDPRAERAGASVQVGTRRRFDWSGAALSQTQIRETAATGPTVSGRSAAINAPPREAFTTWAQVTMCRSSTMKPAPTGRVPQEKRTRPMSAKRSAAIACALHVHGRGEGAGLTGDVSGVRRFHVVVT